MFIAELVDKTNTSTKFFSFGFNWGLDPPVGSTVRRRTGRYMVTSESLTLRKSNENMTFYFFVDGN